MKTPPPPPRLGPIHAIPEGEEGVFVEALGSIAPEDWRDEASDVRRANPAFSRRESLVEAMLQNAIELAAERGKGA